MAVSTRRSIEKWQHQYIISKTLLESMEPYENDDNLIRSFCVALRNPIVFDNQVTEVCHNLPYKLDSDDNGQTSKDHLIGMSNIVLYIFKNKIYKRWKSVEDFKKSIKALQVLLKIPKSLNNKGSYKSWQFDVDNINECIRWDIKLKNENINHLISKNGDKVSIDEVWNNWFEEYSDFL